MSPQTIGPNPAYSQISQILLPISQIPSEMPYQKRPSVSSLQSSNSLNGLEPQIRSARSLLSSKEEIGPVLEQGVTHINKQLEARRYKTTSFTQTLLELLMCLSIPSWSSVPMHSLSPQFLKIHKVSGSLTNAVFFVSYPNIPTIKTVLLRIYGPSSSDLISRPKELHTLHVLSSEYRIGPRVYGTFANGRVEEYFDSTALSFPELRDPKISRWIGARMAELHSVDIGAIESSFSDNISGDVHQYIAVQQNVQAWLPLAKDVLSLPGITEVQRAELDIDNFLIQWEKYVAWLFGWQSEHGSSKIVFAHNDAQYGNLLKLSNTKDVGSPHRQIIVVDFEYAAPNPAAYDIANHFHEWTANYQDPNPHLLDFIHYPSANQRRNFYEAYLSQTRRTSTKGIQDVAPHFQPEGVKELDSEVQFLEAQVRVWSPASHANWAIWGIVQARENVVLGNDVTDETQFDYLGYAICRMAAFRRELKMLNVLPQST